MTQVADDAPTPVPAARDPSEATLLAEALIRRRMVSALDPRRAPDAADVNAQDHVPASTWIRHVEEKTSPLGPSDGPPQMPLRVREAFGSDRLAVTDARGIAYQLLVDAPKYPGLRTGAAAAASRLVRGLGYIVPEAWVIEVPEALLHGDEAGQRCLARAYTTPSGNRRVAAMRWPVGIDLGPTPQSGVRSDDPNDTIPHADRRSLRALRVVAAWLHLVDVGPEITRDVYVGVRGAGHVVHVVFGLEDALGVGGVISSGASSTDPIGDPLTNLWSFGFASVLTKQTKSPWVGVGNLGVVFDPEDAHTAWPYEPVIRTQPADGYWMAKRIAALPDAAVEQAVDAATIENPASRAHFLEVLQIRRAAVVKHWSSLVTPCEAVRVTRGELVVRDNAIRWKHVTADASSYSVSYYDDEGRRVADTIEIPAAGVETKVPVPTLPYVVVRVVAVRREAGPKGIQARSAPRAAELHIAGSDTPMLVGVRH